MTAIIFATVLLLLILLGFWLAAPRCPKCKSVMTKAYCPAYGEEMAYNYCPVCKDTDFAIKEQIQKSP